MNATSIARWREEVGRRLPGLSRPQVKVLALWSLGVTATQSCGLSTVSAWLARALEGKADTLRQRLREFYREASRKRGNKRRTLAVEPCFAGLLRWVLDLWKGHRVVLALDATPLADRFVVLTLSVLYRGCALPVAWRVLRANQPDPWQPHWLALLEHARAAVPPGYFVLVLTDRGLYAPWLFEAIVQAGFHPLMRVNAGGYFKPEGEADYRPLSDWASEPGTSYCGPGVAFKDHPVACTLVAHRDAAHEEAWRLLTDLGPDEVQASWYAWRAWVEQGYKDAKSGGFDWQWTRMTDPHRVQRFWLVLAVAMLWALAVGGAEETEEAAAAARPPRPGRGPAKRRLSVFRRGCIAVQVWLTRATARLPAMTFVPEPLPEPFAPA